MDDAYNPSVKNADIIIIKTGSTFDDLAENRGDFEDWISSGINVPAELVRVYDVLRGKPLPPPRSIGGAIITGSHAMVTDRAEWSERTAAWLSEAVSAETPILGICYGHQLLAHALGGIVDDNPSGREMGTLEITLSREAHDDPLFHGLRSQFMAQISHVQSALTLPSEAVLLGSSDLDPHQAFSVGNCAWGVQFHPEFDAQITTAYIGRRSHELRDSGLDPDLLMSACRDTPVAASILDRFARFIEER